MSLMNCSLGHKRGETDRLGLNFANRLSGTRLMGVFAKMRILS